MVDAYTGGCACGEVRYQVFGRPMAENLCQCRQCQRQTGTGHGTYLTFAGAVMHVQGEAKSWKAVGENGTVKHSAFCPTCGSPLYLTFPDMAEIVALRAGSLDDPARYEPQMLFWTAAAQPWDKADPALTPFEKLPPMPSHA